MDRRERLDDPDFREGLLAFLQGWQARIWTALPGIVVAVDLVKMTVSVQPTIQARIRDAVGVYEWVQIPVLVDVPVLFQSSGGYTLTFPVKVGDEALVIFSSRCIDSWWERGGSQIQAELRMHDLSDGFALIGPRSQPHKLSSISSSGVELRNDFRTAFVKIADDGSVTVQSSSHVYATAPLITATGDVTVNGNLRVTGTVLVDSDVNVIGALRNAGTNVGKTHVHSGGTLSGGLTGTPT